MEHRWVGWRHETVKRSVGRGHVEERMRLWRCSCGAEVYAGPTDDLRGTPCSGSDAKHARHFA